jgi:predicted Zn-dependent protease
MSLGLSLASGLPPAPQGGADSSLNDLLRQARNYEKQQNYVAAERVYGQALALASKDPEILERAGVLYQTELKFKESVDLLQRVVERDRRYPEANFFLGASFLGLNDFPHAIEAFRNELKDPHPHPRCRYYLGVALESAGQEGEAVAEFNRAVSENPKDADALYELALVHKNASLKAIDRLREIDPDSFQLHRLMGEIYADDERYDEAVKEYQAALAKRPDDASLHYGVAVAYWAEHQLNPARQEFTLALQRDPDNPLIKLYLGDIAVREHRFDDAMPYLQAAATAQPGMSRVHILLGRCYEASQNPARAQAEFARAAQLDPSDPQPHYLLAQTYRELHQPQESARELTAFEALSKIEKNRKLSAIDRERRANE